MFIFNLNVVFTTNFLKMAPIRVRFSPGFPTGAGFDREEFALACFERHAGAVKNGAFSIMAALACSQEQDFTERSALAPRREDNFTGRKQVLFVQLDWSADPTWRIFFM
jgi:hypothetical protein